MQAQGHVQFLLNYFVFGMDLQAPSTRRASATTTDCEWRSRRRSATPCATALTAMGHVLIDQPSGAFGGAQAIVRLPQGFAAGSDPRKDGMAVGY